MAGLVDAHGGGYHPVILDKGGKHEGGWDNWGWIKGSLA